MHSLMSVYLWAGCLQKTAKKYRLNLSDGYERDEAGLLLYLVLQSNVHHVDASTILHAQNDQSIHTMEIEHLSPDN